MLAGRQSPGHRVWGMAVVTPPCQAARVGSAREWPGLWDAGEAKAAFAMPGSGFADVSHAATSC